MVIYPKKDPLPPDADTKVRVDKSFRPYDLRNEKAMEELREKICNMVYKCTPIHSAFRACGYDYHTYYRWKTHYEEEKEKYEGTNNTTLLIDFFDPIYESNGNNESKLAEVLYNKAIDEEDLDAVKYALDKLHKWKETKSVEVDTAEDKTFELNIVPMEDKVKDNSETDDE